MAMENLIALQSEGLRSIGEPTGPRPNGVQNGSVLVVVDVNKTVSPAAVHWALGNVVRKGEQLKILGIITHVPNPMGFMVRVDQSTRGSPNIMELQFEIAAKKEAIWRTNFLKEWCDIAQVKLDVDVKAGNNPKVIVIDEAKAMGAYHVVLDKSMKKDRKYFVENLSCFVSRVRSNGGMDTLRSFHAGMSNKLPPMAPTTPKKAAATGSATESMSTTVAGHQSKVSMASSASSSSSRGGSSMSFMSFEFGGEPTFDDFIAQEGDPVSIPNIMDAAVVVDSPPTVPPVVQPQLTIRINPQPPNQLYNLLRGGAMSQIDGGNNGVTLSGNNPLRKPVTAAAGRSGSNEDSAELQQLQQQQQHTEQRPLTPRTEFRFEQGPTSMFQSSMQQQGITPAVANHTHGWIGQLNVAPEFAGSSKMNMGSSALAATLQTQASFNSGRKLKQQQQQQQQQGGIVSRCDKISMDLHWPLMHWADCRSMKLRSQHKASSNTLMSSSSNSSLSNFRGLNRRPLMAPPVSGLNYSDMVDSD